jgi:uncharacterized protein (DUF2141 family)
MLSAFIYLLMLTSLPGHTGKPDNGYPLLVEVTNVSPKKGPVMVAVFNTADGFPMEPAKAVYREKIQPVNGRAQARFEMLQPGTYAVALFHDTNLDGQLNLSFLGIPKEGYGVSNNVRNRFSAPKFGQASFRHDQETRLQIQLRY